MKLRKIFLATVALTCIFSTYNSFSDEDYWCLACMSGLCPEHGVGVDAIYTRSS